MFYYSDNVVFPTKMEALNYYAKTGKNIYFNYYDSLYDSIDWSIEPNLSLMQYYVLQAQRILEKYDYLILCFSGGYDSTQILEVFNSNNIKLDKIIIVGAFSQDEHTDSDENNNLEVYKNAFPTIERLGLSSISEKIDYTEYFRDVTKIKLYEYGSNWINHIGSSFSPHHMIWHQIDDIAIPLNWRDKKTGIIFGKERTLLYTNKKKLGFRFFDNGVNDYGNSKGTEYSDRINFFWDPEFPSIILKQLHLLKKSFNLIKSTLTSVNDEDIIKFLNANITMPKLNDKGIQQSLHYQINQHLLYKSPKNNLVLSKRDSYLKKCLNEPIYSLYKTGLIELHNKINQDIYTKQNSFELINKRIFSKFYQI